LPNIKDEEELPVKIYAYKLPSFVKYDRLTNTFKFSPNDP